MNFTAYQEIKKFAYRMQPHVTELPSYQVMMIGLISGAMGPFSNAPIDTIKTRTHHDIYYLLPIPSDARCNWSGLQKATAEPGTTAFQRVVKITKDMWKMEGFRSFYKGITPRVLRVAPGQAIVFAVYERVKRTVENYTSTREDDGYSE